MDCIATRTPYRQTNHFSKIVLDYVDQLTELRPFFSYPPTIQGLQKVIEERKRKGTDRKILVKVLTKQYEAVAENRRVKKNIEALASPDTFTITTAHQNNIFTGPLYFIYKILHAIRLADYCNKTLPAYHFVPVYYMGSEDADLDELNHIYLGGEKLTWDTGQTGAVGRMKVDKELIKLIGLMEGQLSVQPFGKEIISLIRNCYRENETIQSATFRFVHALFSDYGLIVLLPDNPELKKQMVEVFKDDLLNQTASAIVEKTTDKLEKAGYKVQANPREINLFYLKDHMRERIVKKNVQYSIFNTQYSFSEAELMKELDEHPDHFSPNVILRGLYQETILPNLVFIGGGGETAYWLQLKDLFDHYAIPFPVLVLRNSFMMVEKKWQERVNKLGFSIDDLFLSGEELLNRLVSRESKQVVKLNGSLIELEQLYEMFKKQATAVDSTLEKHVEALKLRSVHELLELEKKMLRAEKRKFTDQQRQIFAIKEHLFPKDGLQERIENITYYYAKWGRDFIQQLYAHSLSWEQEFVVMREK